MQITVVKANLGTMLIDVTVQMDSGTSLTFSVTGKDDFDKQVVRYQQFLSDYTYLKALEGARGATGEALLRPA